MSTQKPETINFLDNLTPTFEPETKYSPTNQVKDQDFTYEYSVKSLPSKGLFYPKGWWVKYRRFGFGEIRYLVHSKLDEANLLTYSMQGVTTSFGTENLTMGDLSFLLALRKVSFVGDTLLSCTFNCPICHEENVHYISKEHIKYNELLEIPKTPVYLTLSHGVYEMEPLTAKRYIELCYLDKQKDPTALAVSMIKNPSESFDELYDKFFKYNSMEDEGYLEELAELFNHSVKEVQVSCINDKCTYHHTIDLDDGETLIKPFRKSGDDVKIGIGFGNPR